MTVGEAIPPRGRERLRLAVLTDVHSGAPPAPQGRWHSDFHPEGIDQRVQEEARRLVGAGCDAFCLLGDLVHDGSRREHRRIVGLVRSVAPCPVLVVPGNHDPLLRADTGLPGIGAVDLQRLNWKLHGVLSNHHELVTLSHFPLKTREAAFARRGLRYAGDLFNADELFAALAQSGQPRVVLHGHLHAKDAIAHDSVLQLGHAALIEQHHAGRIVDLSGGPTV